MPLGVYKQVYVEGKGIVEIKTVQGNVELLYGVQYVPTGLTTWVGVGTFFFMFTDDYNRFSWVYFLMFK